MRKKRVAVLLGVIICILLVLFFPIPNGTYDDGGTREYCALTYKIVVWNKLIAESSEDGSGNNVSRYHKISIYWFPDNLKTIDELWTIACNSR